MIQVREYARLTKDTGESSSLDLGITSAATFDWLISLAEQRRSDQYISREGRSYLKLDSYVGYLQSPSGEGIEVLPKTSLGKDNPDMARLVLRKMLASSLHLQPREMGAALLQRMDMPLHEWLFNQFLTGLSRLVAQGLKFYYERIEEESFYIRGQIDMAAQLRQPPGRANLFHIRHDIFSPNRIENRLLKTALEYVHRCCRHPENWRLANELVHVMEPVDVLHNPLGDLPKWSNNKFLQSYQAVKPWCQLILERLNPNFQKGKHEGITLMFPMEKLFESHVSAYLAKQIASPWKLKFQAASAYLTTHQPIHAATSSEWFNLQPDLVLNSGTSLQVMDTKWKLLNGSAGTREGKYNLKQQDFYQLFAYGQKYQGGAGDMMLIYPAHPLFNSSLPCFHFDSSLRLWVVPFCLEKDELVAGGWTEAFPAFIQTRTSAIKTNGPLLESFFV